MALRLVIAGINGRMGREVAAAADDAAFRLTGGVVRAGAGSDGRVRSERPSSGEALTPIFDNWGAALGEADVVIDFTGPEGAVAGARAAAAAGVPFVSGTTGLDPRQLGELREAGARVPVFYARNMSAGVGAVIAAVERLARGLAGYDVEIVEHHHRYKEDAPSGTALALVEAARAGWGASGEAETVFGRSGARRRAAGEIGVHAVRGGGNSGEHTVLFAGDGEEVRIVHRAYGRRAFADGALRAARFVAAGRAAGFYGPLDLIEIESATDASKTAAEGRETAG